MGAKCEICNKSMMKAKGCLDKDFIIDGERFRAIPWIDRFGDSSNCGDCNCKEGEFHHLGCDMEICPCCGGQLISCDCNFSDEIFVFKTKRKSGAIK